MRGHRRTGGAPMTEERERIEHLVSVDALGIATPEERAELDRLLSADPANGALLRESADAAALLARDLAALKPPPFSAIEGKLEGTVTPLRPRRSAAIAWSVAAVTALAAAGFLLLWRSSADEVARLQSDL